MKENKPTVVSGALAIAMLFSVSAFGEPHPLQQQLQRQLNEAKATQEAAEKSNANKRQQLLAQHMQMLQEVMQQMRAAKPQAGISMQEHEEWITEHQKLMDEALQQMIMDQGLLVQGQN
jgi:hypothetical protein